MSSLYDAVRASVEETGNDSRVEVNQRALIDKILARYASAGAVYRELLQNSNDADATAAEIYFTTQSESNIVQQVLYRNNGMPFRDQDWARLKKIAEGNPDVSKVGAFGVGAYTMFSICEEPLVISGDQALAFVWRGDALWTKTAPSVPTIETKDDSTIWTSFVLPARDPYPLPDMVEFAQFLCASLTFTKSLHRLRVFVNKKEVTLIQKTQVQEPTAIRPPQSSSWWKNDGAVTSSQNGTFFLPNKDKAIQESVYQLDVLLDNGEASSIRVRYVSAVAQTKISAPMAKRMERVTKKKPPSQVTVQIFINAQEEDVLAPKKRNRADRVTQSFLPQSGKGRIFIGFRTSQTTGLAAHLAAPFVPTVEREAIDLQDPTLRMFNSELLEFSGILMRLTLENTMSLIDQDWKQNEPQRLLLEQEYAKKAEQLNQDKTTTEDTTLADSMQDDDASTTTTATTTDENTNLLFGFAKFMAKGITKKIVSVVNTVGERIIDDTTMYLQPSDPRPLSSEERHAILLMQSFCPQQSTPDPLVGTCLAQGFARCMPALLPPVLTKSGVVRGDLARLPHQGIESFVDQGVIRRVVYDNAQEYHDVIARCRPLGIDDLANAIQDVVLEQPRLIFLLKWWTKICRAEPSIQRWNGVMTLRESIRFYRDAPNTPSDSQKTISALKDLLFYVDKNSALWGKNKHLPVPDSVIPRDLQDQIGISTLGDSSLQNWFSPLPIEIWIDYISHHRSMTAGIPEDEALRIQILALLSKEHDQRSFAEQGVFSSFCERVLAQKRCIPFDSSEPTQYAADYPSSLYLYSAELKAFDGIGAFHKVAHSLKLAGVTEQFLIALGVRTSVAVDFLFSNLDTLKWSDDPRPLVEYLRTASLTSKDISLLKHAKYLPSENDNSRTFSPSELFLPNRELRVFPFIRLLQWPSEDGLSNRSENGKFLLRLGMRDLPSLEAVLSYISERVKDDELRLQCLDFVCKRMGGPQEVYHAQYARLRASRRQDFKILPTTRKVFLDPTKTRSELQSPMTCYSDQQCFALCYPVIDSKLGEKGKLYCSLFQCPAAPPPAALLEQLLYLVQTTKNVLASLESKEVVQLELSRRIDADFTSIFTYLSTRTSEFNHNLLAPLRTVEFIPCLVEGLVFWYKPDQVYFKNSVDDGLDSLTSDLFQAIAFSPFLAAVGVKEEASTRDLFVHLISSPAEVLTTLGEKKYRLLLRRFAADLPFSRVNNEIRNSPFLLAYSAGEDDNDEKKTETNFKLAKASEIFVIDNSFFGRMFPVDRAPHESDLEDFYALIGSPYISKQVEKRFEIVGKPRGNTGLTTALSERLMERGPLLVSPSVTSRPLMPRAASMLEEDRLEIYEASSLLAVYSLFKKERRQRTTCCSKPIGGRKHALYVTSELDWFDVGYAIGDLILQRCQLEDAFFIGSLLEAPLEQLRARGFPVDRILKPKPEPVIKPAKKQPEGAKSSTQAEGKSADTKEDTKAAAPPSAPAPSSTQEDKAKAAEPPSVPPPSSTKQPEAPAPTGFVQPSRDQLATALKQMFPHVPPSYIEEKLGKSPTTDDARNLAEDLARGNHPKADEDTDDIRTVDSSEASVASKPKSSFRKKLGRAFGGMRGSNRGMGSEGAPTHAPPTNQTYEEGKHGGGEVSPEHDAAGHENLKSMLQQRANASAAVNPQGLVSFDSVVSDIPKEYDDHEMIPGHSLKPFPGQKGDGCTHNGIRIFSSRNAVGSEEFLRENDAAVESFALVLSRLASVFELGTKSIAIFHDPAGGTIAFNSQRALHFNVRFFHSLHFLQNNHESYDCYAYWFVTFAHELAHNFVSLHNRAHGFYTESYVTMYMPAFLAMLGTLGVK